MVSVAHVISVLGDTSEARTVTRWLAADKVIPKSTAGRDGSGRANLSRHDVAMIILGMAAPVAKRAPQFAGELARLATGHNSQSLVEVIENSLADHETLTVSEIWLPSYEDGGLMEARVRLKKDKPNTFTRFYDARHPHFTGLVFVSEDEKGCKLYRHPETPPPMSRWRHVTSELLQKLASLFAEVDEEIVSKEKEPNAE